MTTFNSDQQQAMLQWLIWMKEAGLTLEEVIDGLIDGTLTRPVETSENIPVEA